MRKIGRRIAGIAAIAAVAVLASGCTGGARRTSRRGAEEAPPPESATEKIPERFLRKPPPPPPERPAGQVRAEIAEAVKQLVGAPPLQMWQAEDRLIELGSAVAPYVRPVLRSGRGEARAAAARILGEVLGAGAARDLVPLLGDEVLDVRYHAICVLRRVTGQDFGYLHVDEPEKRAKAVARWRAWLASWRGRRRTR